MNDLIKNTEQTHPDYPYLQQTLSTLEKIANNINNFVRTVENSNKCLKIQRSIVDCDFV